MPNFDFSIVGVDLEGLYDFDMVPFCQPHVLDINVLDHDVEETLGLIVTTIYNEMIKTIVMTVNMGRVIKRSLRPLRSRWMRRTVRS